MARRYATSALTMLGLAPYAAVLVRATQATMA